VKPLPIDPHLAAITSSVARDGALVLVAPPGSGKTTRVPRAMLDAGTSGEIVVLEPRRLAARLAARRVAEELGEELGATIGFQTRFEDVRSSKTRIRFVTEGILTRRLLVDPKLAGVGAVVLDEVHERHLVGDMATSLVARLRRDARPDLRVVAMSATLETERLAAFLGATVMDVPGRAFPVEVEHLARADDRPLELQVASAIRALDRAGDRGDILVFLPGAREIRRAGEACAGIARDLDRIVVQLTGSLSAAEQDRAVRPADRPKIILSTNVAESSVTIDGVTAVIDSGLANVASHAPWSGVPMLKTAKIARASAEQRAGRAGRTSPGRCLRLYTAGDFAARPAHDLPEIARADLAEPILELVASGMADPATFAWLEAPPRAALDAALALLRRLGAIEGESESLRPTAIGQRMLRFPVHPRLARVVVEGERLGVAEHACVAAALLSERSLRSNQRDDAWSGAAERSDLAPLAVELTDLEKLSPERLRARGYDINRVASVKRALSQLRRAARDTGEVPHTAKEEDDALLKALFAGFVDRLGKLRRPEGATGRTGIEIVFAEGGSAVLDKSSVVRDATYAVALDAEERAAGAGGRALVRVASEVDLDWILETCMDRIVDEATYVHNASLDRVERIRRMRLGQMVLEESRDTDVPPHEASRVLAAEVMAKGGLAVGDEARRFLARLAFLREHRPDLDLPVLDARELVLRACEGAVRLRDIEGIDAAAIAAHALDAEGARALRDLAPERVKVGQREVRVDYEPGKPPSIASRLQDFFGTRTGPTIAGGRVPLVLHLLAPNLRDVQVTTDLAGFWERHYPAIAKELRRRYPRHSWPDDPHAAEPPAPRAPRPPRR
jgi:ATP-dependent helicase HrpB